MLSRLSKLSPLLSKRRIQFPSTNINQLKNRNLSSTPSKSSTANAQARAARRSQKSINSTKNDGENFMSSGRIGIIALIGLLGYISYDIKENPEGSIANLYKDSPIDFAITWLYDSTYGNFKDFMEPVSDKLLPDWPTDPCYANVAMPGQPAPPLLILDLERTLIGSSYDAKYGWRHVKRPGLDTFLDQLSPYYEIVIQSENDLGSVMEIFVAIDKENKCHKLGSAHAEVRDGKMIKRLDLMNRDIGRIVLVDDDPIAFQHFKRNTLQIKPFTDVNDKDDRELLDLIPLLQALIHEGATDFRNTLDGLGTHHAKGAVEEYQMRLTKADIEQNRKRNSGIGGVLRQSFLAPKKQLEPIKEKKSLMSQIADEDNNNDKKKVKEINQDLLLVKTNTPSTPAVKKKGWMFEQLDNMEKEKEEVEMKKREKMNEIFMKRQMAKQEAEQEDLKRKQDGY
jgi:import inner membrane translocase subunit TIM50